MKITYLLSDISPMIHSKQGKRPKHKAIFIKRETERYQWNNIKIQQTMKGDYK